MFSFTRVYTESVQSLSIVKTFMPKKDVACAYIFRIKWNWKKGKKENDASIAYETGMQTRLHKSEKKKLQIDATFSCESEIEAPSVRSLDRCNSNTHCTFVYIYDRER